MKGLIALFALMFMIDAIAAGGSSKTADEKIQFPYRETSGVGNLLWADKRADFNNDPWAFVKMSADMLVAEVPDNNGTGSKVLIRYIFDDDGKLLGALFLYEDEPNSYTWNVVEKELTSLYGEASPSTWNPDEQNQFELGNISGYTLRGTKVVRVIHSHTTMGDQTFQQVAVGYLPRFEEFAAQTHEH